MTSKPRLPYGLIDFEGELYPMPDQPASSERIELHDRVKQARYRLAGTAGNPGSGDRVIVAMADEIERLRYDLEMAHGPSGPPRLSHETNALHTDDVAVNAFALAMKAKLAKKRAEGRGGWDDPAQCDVEFLALLLTNHVSKGDPVDVANLAMMLFHRDGSAALREVAARCLRTSDEGTPDEVVRLRAEVAKLRDADPRASVTTKENT